jgi:hypothetical protein
MSRIAAVTRIPSALSSRAQHDLDRKLASVLPPPGELDPRADLLRQGLSGGSGPVRDQPFREAFRNDVLHLLPDQLIAAVSELFLRLKIQQSYFSTLVHHHHRVRSRFQQPAVLRVRLLSLAEIVAELRKAPQISGRIAQCGEGDTRQKS